MHRDAVDFSASPRTFQWRFGFAKIAFERIRDVDASPLRAVEGPGEVFAFVRDAAVFLGVLLVDAVAGLVGGVGAVDEQKVGAVRTERDVDLHACAGPGNK